MSHLSNDQMSGYARRTLDAEALLFADDHLSCCDECRNRLIDVEGLKETVESLRRDLRTALDAPTGHLPYDQIEARAEGRLRGAAREVAETHIEHCAACARQARDLEAFAAAFRARAQEQAAASAAAAAAPTVSLPAPPAPAPASPRPATGAEVSADAAQALLGAGTAPARSRLWPIVLGLFAAVVVAAAIVGAMRARIGLLNETVEDLSRRNEELTAQAAQTAPQREPASGVVSEDLPAQSVPGESAAAVPDPAAPPPEAAQPAQLPETTSPAADGAAATPEPPPAPAQAAEPVPAVALQDQNGPVGLDGSGNLLGLSGVPPADVKTITTALERGSLEVPDDLTTLSAIPKALAVDDSATGMPLSSGAATYVRAARPTLSWQPVEGAQVYTIVLFNPQGRPLYYGGPTKETSWTPPAPLRRGATYTWRVGAYRPAAAPGPTSATEKLAGAASRFKVIDAASASALERALRATSGSRVVAGVLYARAGLLDDAGREFRALLEQNPDSGLAKALLASVEAARLP